MKPLVELRELSFGYGTTQVLDRVDFHLHAGQFAALVGPSGSGKTTFLKLILQLLRPSHGQLYCRGNPPLRVAYVPQLETVDWNFPVTVEEVVLMGLTQRSGRWPWPRKTERKRALAVLEQLEIAPLAPNHIRDLSGGQQQRVFLARALIAEPDLLVLDEPTTGVDMRSSESIFHWLAHLNQQGMTILLTTHDLNMAAAHIPWIVCLNQRIVAQGTPETVLTEVVLSKTYQGEMMVIRKNGMIFVQQKPHAHSYRDLIPKPVAGGLPDHDLSET
ncbi:MAG: metal ABC transporter ATP-binding protein [Chloroflexi bacterium]|nr:metal ABC transporter ATP-binding protein [Chloroflexota bacterium]